MVTDILNLIQKKVMKMNEIAKLPDKVKVGGFYYKIYYPYDFDTENMSDCETMGLFEPSTLSIKIKKFDGGGIAFPNSIIVGSFLHEIFHAIDRIYCDDRIDGMDSVFSKDEDRKETAIPALSRGWYQVLRDNNILTLKTIPKKVKVGGHVYNIKYPYDLDGNDAINVHAIEYAKNLIKIRDTHTHGIKYDYQMIRQLLINYLTCAVLEVYAYCFSIDKDLIFQFAGGLYQVLIDNNIEELIHKYK